MSEEEKISPVDFQDPVLGYDAAHFIDLAMQSGGAATEEEMDKAVRLNAVLEAAFLIAASDGVLTDEEFAALGKGARSLFEQASQQQPNYREPAEIDPFLSEQDLNATLQSFADLLDEQGYAKRIAYIAETIPGDEMRQKAFMLAIKLSKAGGAPATKNSVVDELAQAFSFSPEKAATLLAQVEASA